MKYCKKFGKLSKKINVSKFKESVSGSFGAMELEKDPDDNLENT